MLPAIVTMLAILVIGAVTVGLVVMGIEGRGRRRAPKLADSMTQAARHLNGEKVPQRLAR